MAANPALVDVSGTANHVPAPFPDEHLLCRRDGIKFDIDGVVTHNGKWSAKGSLFLSNLRMVFLAHKADQASGLAAFDLPLVYIRNDKFNQPIFGCNNLSGECWPVADDGGPTGRRPPHKFKLAFLEGGVGTFLPLYFTFVTSVRTAERDKKKAEGMKSQSEMNMQMGQAFVDPSDPTTIFLTQPVGEESRLSEPPKYATNYGADERYSPMV